MDDDESSSDPLIQLTYDVHDLIFQHLSGSEVKEISKVNSRWYESLGNSIVAMQKMVLQIKTSRYQKWKKSTRRYVSMVCDFGEDASNIDVYKEVLYEVAGDLRNLKIRNMGKIQLKHVDLSKLKKLEVSWIASKETLDSSLKLNSKKLKSLRIKAGTSDFLKILLHKQVNLQHLELTGGSQLLLCQENLDSAVNLRLVSLKVGFMAHNMFDKITTEENFFNFLDKQEPTLHKISITTTVPSIILKVFALRNIENLKISCLFYRADRNFQLNKHGKKLSGNKKVTKAKISAVARTVSELLHLLPNLHQLQINKLTTGLLKSVVISAPNLKKLFSNSFNDEKIREAYEELKHKDNVNQHIQLLPVDKKFKISF